MFIDTDLSILDHSGNVAKIDNIGWIFLEQFHSQNGRRIEKLKIKLILNKFFLDFAEDYEVKMLKLDSLSTVFVLIRIKTWTLIDIT